MRHNSKTPDELKMVIETDDEQLVRRLPTVKIQRYTIEEIFEKELYYFLPFHIFVHEKELSLYNKDEKKLEVLTNEYKEISHRLVVLWQQSRLDERTLDCIINGMKQVLHKIAHKYQRIVKESEKAMGGEILDYPAKTAWREGIAKGREEGSECTLISLVTKLLSKHKSVEEVADLLDLDIERVKEIEQKMLVVD